MLRVGPIVRVVNVEEPAEGAIGKPAILMRITTRCPRSKFLILFRRRGRTLKRRIISKNVLEESTLGNSDQLPCFSYSETVSCLPLPIGENSPNHSSTASWSPFSGFLPENAAGSGTLLGPSPAGGHEVPVAMPTFRLQIRALKSTSGMMPKLIPDVLLKAGGRFVALLDLKSEPWGPIFVWNCHPETWPHAH